MNKDMRVKHKTSRKSYRSMGTPENPLDWEYDHAPANMLIQAFVYGGVFGDAPVGADAKADEANLGKKAQEIATSLFGNTGDSATVFRLANESALQNVKELQKGLVALGLYTRGVSAAPGPIDGKVGPWTRAAFKKLEADPRLQWQLRDWYKQKSGRPGEDLASPGASKEGRLKAPEAASEEDDPMAFHKRTLARSRTGAGDTLPDTDDPMAIHKRLRERGTVAPATPIVVRRSVDLTINAPT